MAVRLVFDVFSGCFITTSSLDGKAFRAKGQASCPRGSPLRAERAVGIRKGFPRGQWSPQGEALSVIIHLPLLINHSPGERLGLWSGHLGPRQASPALSVEPSSLPWREQQQAEQWRLIIPGGEGPRGPLSCCQPWPLHPASPEPGSQLSLSSSQDST